LLGASENWRELSLGIMDDPGFECRRVELYLDKIVLSTAIA
jgi:hypothetical protein